MISATGRFLMGFDSRGRAGRRVAQPDRSDCLMRSAPIDRALIRAEAGTLP